MKLNIYKKIIVLTYLTIFLFGLFIPLSQTFAESSPLILSADPVNIKPRDISKITATLTGKLEKKENLVVIFSSTSSGNYTLSNKICDMDNPEDIEQTCSITFTATSDTGQFHINAILAFKTDYNNYLVKKLKDKSLLFQDGIIGAIASVDINVAVPIQPLKCDPPQRLNDAKDSCILDTNTTYTPLAPLPGLGEAGCVDSSGKTITDKDGNTVPCIDTQFNKDSNSCPFGNYLNIIIKLVIGIAAVLAMVMIVMGGVEYMTSDLISSKESGKEQITHAIFGLLIALGAYLILNTINPNLLNACLDKLPEATIVIEHEPESAPWSTFAEIYGTTSSCKEGYINIQAFTTKSMKINVCKSISNNLTKMLSAAKNNNPSILLGGWGSRTYDQQVALRKQHGCHPDIFISPSNSCVPPTARPGTSKHESGKAVDFTCDGAPIAGTSCYNWLKENAKTYGFINYPKEPWHWSDDGK